MAQAYYGVVENGMVVFPKRVKLNNGTRVLVTPQIDLENEWLIVTQAAKRFELSVTLVRQWMRSGKVRVHSSNPKLVNADDLEDAAEQHHLFDSTMQVIERDDKK